MFWLLTVLGLHAASVSELMREPQMQSALAWMKANQAWTLQQQISLCEIPAPPFAETERGREFSRRLSALGLSDVRTDKESNVLARLTGAALTPPYIVLSAHLDTVFPAGLDVRVTREGQRYKGLGMGDDCRGLAVILTVARAFREAKVQTPATVLLVATVGEEGQGDLRGVRHLFTKELPGQIAAFISVDGTGWRLTSRGVGSNRYRIAYKGRGGHSYGAFGMPNPAHAMGRAIARIADIQVPASPRTTFNVGTVTGGTSVNSVPIEVSMELDLRSESPRELAALDERVRAALRAALEAEKRRWPDSKAPLDLEIQSIGVRPAAEPSDDQPIVQHALSSAKALGLPILATATGSTDSNLPLSLGIPAVTITGGGFSPNAHSIDEWYEERPDSFKGAQWAALLTRLLAASPR